MELSYNETVFIRDYEKLLKYAQSDTPDELNQSCVILRKWLIDKSKGEVTAVAETNSIIINYQINQVRLKPIPDNIIWVSFGDALWRMQAKKSLPKYVNVIVNRFRNQDKFLNSTVGLIRNPETNNAERLSVRHLIEAGCYLACAVHLGEINNKKVSSFYQKLLQHNLLLRKEGKDEYSFFHYDIKAIIIVILNSWWELYSTLRGKENARPSRKALLASIKGLSSSVKLELHPDQAKMLAGKKITFSSSLIGEPVSLAFLTIEVVD